MANPLDRSWYNTLVDDDGSGTTGTPWNKAAVDALMDSVDASLVPLVANPVPGDLAFATNATLARTTADGADTGSLSLAGGGNGAVNRGASLVVHGNEHASAPGVVQIFTGQAAAPMVQLSRADFQPLLQVLSATGVLNLPFGRVQFPATPNPSADLYTIDDYRELPWSPIFVGSGGQSGQVYDLQEGSGVKVGRQVTLWGRLRAATLGTLSGTIRIGGLPIPVGAVGGGTITYWSGVSSPFTYMTLLILTSPSVAEFYFAPTAGAQSLSTLSAANIVPGFYVAFTLSYFAAS